MKEEAKAGAAGDWRERLKSVAVLGAGGKMGSGIAWVALKAMADLDAVSHGAPGSGEYELILVDADRTAFKRLREYLRGQLLKSAEKNISELRAWAKDRADLIENGEIIDAYVNGALAMTRCGTVAAEAAAARVVFEAVFEDLALKRELYAGLKSRCSPETVFLTNTSSIPISQLDESAGLDGRLLGFHFYNPPAVQKLVELIPGKRTRPEVVALGKDLGKAFGKTLVASKDVAGFIGNGHFIRELLFAMGKFRELKKEWSEPEAWYILNKATQDFLVRPMGIVQLMDYVGLDVFQMIAKVMREHLPSTGNAGSAGNGGSVFADATLDALLAAGIKGGQRGSGEQKDGLLRYDRNKPAGVLADPLASEGSRYVTLAEPGRFAKADAWLGEPPPAGGPSAAGGTSSAGGTPSARLSWSHLAKDPGKAAKLSDYFGALRKAPGNGARLAREFLDHSRSVAEGLVRDGVAASLDDVGQVLKLGFFHLYGPADWGQG